jgi:hypothetical protein
MTTYNHTPLDEVNPIPASGATINAPLAQLDAAIGDLTGLGTTPKSSVAGALGTPALTTAAKTVLGALNELDADVGSPAALQTVNKESLVAAINELMSYIQLYDISWNALPFALKVMGVAAGLISYWRLNELTGDFLDTKRNVTAARSGVITTTQGPGDGYPGSSFDGAGYIDIYSSDFANQLNVNEGSILLHIRQSPAEIEENVIRRIIYLSRSDDSARIIVQKHSSPKRIYFYYIAGGVTKSVSTTYHVSADYVDYVFSWSKSSDFIHVYRDNVLVGSTSGLGTWATPTIQKALIGAYNTGLTDPLKGDLANIAFFNTPLSDANRNALKYLKYPCYAAFLGGSITKGSAASDLAHRFTTLAYNWLNVTTYPNAFDGSEVSAISGSHSWQNLFRLGSLIAKRPRIIVIDSAVNDEDNNISRLAAEAVVRQIRVALPNTKIVSLLNIRVNDPNVNDTTNVNQQTHNDWAALDLQYNIVEADFAAEVQAKVPGTHNLNWYLSDTVHPTDNGHATIATLVEAQLASLQPYAGALPDRLRSGSADFEATPVRVPATSCTRTGTWTLDANGAYVSTEVGATMSLASALVFRSLGIDDGVPGDSPLSDTLGLSINGGAFSNVFLWENGYDLGSIASRTVTIKVLSGTVRVKEFMFI